NSFSEQENRSLRTLPKLEADALLSGDYASEINDYFADQFPLRDLLVGIKGGVEIALWKGENDGILLGENGQLAKRLFDVRRADGSVTSVALDTFDPAHIQAGAQGINRVSSSLGIPFTALLTGRTLDVAESAFDYPVETSDALFDTFYGALDASVDALDTLPMFREKYENGEYVYYKTDHHWTTLGAYYAYAELLCNWGMEDAILPMDAIEKRTVSEAFYGTAWSAGGMKFVAPDTMEFWMLGNEDAFTVTADDKTLDGFYSMGYLERKDKYSAFLDGTHDVVKIQKSTAEDRPTLLMLKDSFANAMAPFLAQHFDLVLLNLSSVRSDFTDVTHYAEEYSADRVLLLYTIENAVTANKLTKLR
ncbi:MAG: hypothetical protein IJF33_02845, partial [Clostridia bacterium]|nr:hypothetical protein [Clostridia bacterium]